MARVMVTKIAGGWRKWPTSYNPAATKLEAQAADILERAAWNRPTWRNELCGKITDDLLDGRTLPRAICTSVREAIAASVGLELQGLQIAPPASASPAAVLAHRSRLRAVIDFNNHANECFAVFANRLGQIFGRIADAVPADLLLETSPFSVSLIDIIPNPTELVSEIVGDLLRLSRDDAAIRPGAVLADRVKTAILQFNKMPEEAARKNPHRLTSPAASGLAGIELVKTFLPEPLAGVFSTPVKIAIPMQTYTEHGAIFAKSGHGKSQTLRAIIANFLQLDDPPALFIIDSLGSLIEGIDHLEIFNTRLKDRLVIIDPTEDPPPALNFFKLQSDELVFYLFKAIDQSFTQRQSTLISYLMELMRAVDGATLLTLIEVCESKNNLYPEAIKTLSPYAQSFFENQLYGPRPDKFVQDTKAQIAQRLYSLGRLGKLTQMFSAPENKFDPLECIRQRKICIINTDARPAHLGGLGGASSILGRFILAQCLDAARSCPKEDRQTALLIVDEAKHYMDDQAALILSDARQFKLGILLATQFPHQLPEGVRKEVNTNTSIKMMGPTEFAVASHYARDMFTTPEAIMGAKSFDRSHAEWITYVANLTNSAVKMSVPFGAIEKMPRMSPADHQRLRASNRARVAATEESPLGSPLAAISPAVRASPTSRPKAPLRTHWNSNDGEIEEV